MNLNKDIAVLVRSLRKVYGAEDHGVVALHGADLDVTVGEFFTLLGPSGCGKTTLLRLVAGFEYPTKGEIQLFGEDIANLPPFKRPVNTVFQNYALFPHMTVAQNVAFGLEGLKRSKSEVEQVVTEMLDLVHMEQLADRKPDQLSGGQRQRVALARAMAPRPKVLLLDEPLSALDLKLRQAMRGELKRIQTQTGITFIFVTHDQEEALAMSDRIAVMSEGKIQQIGSPEEIYEHPTNKFVANFIGETNFIDAELQGQSGGYSKWCDEGGTDFKCSIAEDLGVGEKRTLSLRPENILLVDPSQPKSLPCRVIEKVYIGTDLQYLIRLSSGIEFKLRSQNTPNSNQATSAPKLDEDAAILIPDGAAQVLADQGGQHDD